MISSLSTGKGIFNYVELARLMPDLCFRMVISADKGDIDQTFGDNLPQNIEIYPAQKDVTAFLYDTDLIINMSVPSLCIETFGMTVLEAMPFGVPAIVPNVGGPVELVENGNNGYCLDVSDLDEMVYAVRSALVEDNYNRLSNNTLQRFKEKFR
jgi:glycosyltransferase involved in cell wall biosynthesis